MIIHCLDHQSIKNRLGLNLTSLSYTFVFFDNIEITKLLLSIYVNDDLVIR